MLRTMVEGKLTENVDRVHETFRVEASGRGFKREAWVELDRSFRRARAAAKILEEKAPEDAALLADYHAMLFVHTWSDPSAVLAFVADALDLSSRIKDAQKTVTVG